MQPDNKHILIVEDEPKIAQLLGDYLEREGYRVKIPKEGAGVKPDPGKQSNESEFS